jgi:hypothetical protein
MNSRVSASASTRGNDGARTTSSGEASRRILTWNRRFHFYLGLYFLLFIWLFSISGLLLNNSQWEFVQFWPQREESSVERVIAPPAAIGDLGMARELMQQLGIDGEINRIERSSENDQFRLEVSRPGQILRVEANFATARAEVKEIRLNAWGALQTLHTFSGVSMDEPRKERDWLLTKMWSVAMDALALGLIVLVVSGLYLWYRFRSKRRLGWMALGLGTASCGFFLFGLALLF